MFVVDRLKELIKYKSFQIAPAELESTLVSHDQITDAAVIGQPDPESGELPIAFVVAADPALKEDGVKAIISEKLANYKQLHKVSFVDSIPKSESSKILRRVLRDQL